MLGSSWVPAQLAASQDGLSSVNKEVHEYTVMDWIQLTQDRNQWRVVSFFCAFPRERRNEQLKKFWEDQAEFAATRDTRPVLAHEFKIKIIFKLFF
jgi:hypothetical protein